MDISKHFMKFIYDNYTGIDGFVPSSSYTYLTKKQAEFDTNFENRRNYTTLENNFTPLIDFFMKPIKGTGKKLTTNHTDLQKIYEKARVLKVANIATRDYKLFEQAYYGIIVNEIDKLPILFNILPHQIINITIDDYTIVSNCEWLESIDFKDLKVNVHCIYNLDEELNYGSLKKITLLWLDDDGKYTTEDLGEDKRVKIFDKFYEMTFVAKVGDNNLYDVPATFQLAQTNVNIFNLTSDIRAVYNSAGYALLAIHSDKEIKSIDIGNDTILKLGAMDKEAYFVDCNTDMIDSMREDVQELKEYMLKLFSNNMLNDNVRYTTATSAAISSQNFTFELQLLTGIYEEVVNTILNKCMEMYGYTTSFNFELEKINYNDIETIDEL